tara:strand:+ start:250 stop:546 length:297 start_codon:yes stop_codon:yes gene_type:complete
MENNSNWSEISDDINKAKNSIYEKINSEVENQDLKISLDNAKDEIKNLITNFIKTIEHTIKDEEVKQDTKNVINKIGAEFTEILNIKRYKENFYPEEE